MNIDIVKEDLSKNLGKRVQITEYGMRNKENNYYGVLYKIYNNIFSIKTNDMEKSFSLADLIIGDVVITYY
ncbi:MAG: hypothetical protein IJ574_03500 [Bacilli bacterium]|nr:hypothetical protein [Bacilli bacterium]